MRSWFSSALAPRPLLLLLALSTACSFIANSDDAEQCTTDADCVARGSVFAGTICSAAKICIDGVGAAGTGGSGGGGGGGTGDSGSSGTPRCTTTQECVRQLGDFHICRKSDGRCAKLISAECTRIEGDYKNDNALFIGSVLPSQGSDAANGLPNENAIALALREINNNGGLPPARPGGPTRPLVAVSCNDDSDANTAVTAAKHLTEDLKVPAIIGAAFSGITIKMTTQVTIPANVLTISPSATSVAITGLSDSNLVWRTSPSDAFQASAIATLMPYLEAKVHADAKIADGDPIRVAIFYKGDAYGAGLANALQEKLVFNKKTALENGNLYDRFDYGDPNDPQNKPTQYPQALTRASQFKPHLLFIFGTNESITEIFAKVEQGWTEPAFRPQYVFADSAFVSDVWTLAKEIETSLKTVTVYNRLLGTVPGTTNLNFKTFASLYKSQFADGTSPDVFGTAGAYDATYLLSYAIASQGDKPITGAAIAEGLGRVSSGTPVKAGTTQLSQAFGILTSGQGIDYDGASGPLNFDSTGEAPSDIQFWCVPKGPDGKATTGITSGIYYDAAKDTVDAPETIGRTCGF